MGNRFLDKIIYVAVLMFCLSSCINQIVNEIPDDNTPPVPAAEKVQLELFMRTDAYRTPVLRSLADENGIDRTPLVLIFKGTDANAVFVESVQAFEFSGINKIYINPTKQTTDCRLLIIANPQDSLYMNGDNTPYEFTTRKLDSLLNGKTLSYACSNLITKPLNNPQTSIPYAGNQKIPMSYLEDVQSIDENTEIGTSQSLLEMRRVIAKIVIKSNLPNFTFNAITAVINVPKQGQLHLLGSTLMDNTGKLVEYNTGDSYATDLINTTANGSEQNTESDPIYLYESEATNNTYIIIKGVYEGKSYYYRLIITDSDKNPLNILRNQQYTINISSVLGPGFDNVNDLKSALGSNSDINYDVEIIDESSHEILANENYYLSISNSVFIAYTDATDNADEFELFTLTTNCTVDFSYDNYIVHDNTNWAIMLSYPTPTDFTPEGQAYKSRIPIAANSLTPVSTPVKAEMKGYVDNLYKISLKLGNLEKDVRLRSRWESAIPASGTTLTQIDPWDNNYYLLSGYVEGEAKDWLKLMPGTNVVRNDSASIVVDDGVIYIRVEPNTSGAARHGIIYLTAGKNPGNDPGGSASSYRIKMDIAQREN